MNLQEALAALDALQRKMAAYNHAIGLIYYDGATVAPSGTAANRGESMAILSEASYELSTCKETEELLENNFQGSADLLIAALVDQKKLSKKDVERLCKLVEEIED